MNDVLSTSAVGKLRRISRLIRTDSKRCVWAPLDDTLISGTQHGLGHPASTVREIAGAEPDAILGFLGLLRSNYSALLNQPYIVNLTASTRLSQHTLKSLVGDVGQAVELGVEGVAVHVNCGSKHEHGMLRTLGTIGRECDKAGMPLLAIMYPRTEKDLEDENYENMREREPESYATLVAHAARVGVDLGADIIKTQYTGTRSSFRKVIKACDPIPVVVAGGAAVPAKQALRIAKEAIEVGAAGISFGRNVFSRRRPAMWINALKALVHDGDSMSTVLRRLGKFEM